MERSHKPGTSSGEQSEGPSHRAIAQPTEERSRNDQAMGGYDPEDYPGSGPVPVGHGPVRSEREGDSIPTGIESGEHAMSNPGDVPNTGSSESAPDKPAKHDRRPDRPAKHGLP
ncbi:MAG TPA: hypothetical protein VFS39_10585 [Nitrospira sp.]|nr:hypothetical protein [Nitrospira sp.]